MSWAGSTIPRTGATRWSAIYDQPTAKGALTYVFDAPADDDWRTRYWDVPSVYRKHYLATLANIATLLGLLGTIIGLIRAFTAVSNANPADKADLLSASISVAMNTTAFGLMVAIPLLLVHALLQTKTNQLVDSLEMASVKFLNAVTERQLKTTGA